MKITEKGAITRRGNLNINNEISLVLRLHPCGACTAAKRRPRNDSSKESV